MIKTKIIASFDKDVRKAAAEIAYLIELWQSSDHNYRFVQYVPMHSNEQGTFHIGMILYEDKS